MKQRFQKYALIWGILLAAFLAVVFLAKPLFPGFRIAYDGRFWIALACVLIAFIGNLFCARLALQEENKQKLFYKLPLLTVSRSALGTTLVLGAVLMLIPDCPAWITAIVCVLLLAFQAIALVKASWTADEVTRIDEKVKTQTSFIRNLTVEAQGLVSRAKSEAVRKECQKVYEAVRYSDPMSNEELAAVEAEITAKMGELGTAVGANDEARVKEIAGELVVLARNRNQSCENLR